MSPELRIYKQETLAPLAKSSPEIEWMLYCEGDCAECKGKGVKLSARVYECPCTDQCGLKVTRVGTSSGIGSTAESGRRELDSLANIYGTFQAELEQVLLENYSFFEYRISAVEVHANTSGIATKYYVVNTLDETEISIVFTKASPEGPSYNVDCSGDCISASAKCTERIILADPIQIECTCEGSCNMTISPSEPGGE